MLDKFRLTNSFIDTFFFLTKRKDLLTPQPKVLDWAKFHHKELFLRIKVQSQQEKKKNSLTLLCPKCERIIVLTL